MNTIGDAIYLYQSATDSYVEGTYLDVLWPASLVLVALAAWQAPAPSRHRGHTERTLLGTPIVCGLVATGVLVDAATRPADAFAIALAATTIVLVLARTALTFRENNTLLERSREESLTDALTGLGNRRRLISDLDAYLAGAQSDDPHLLILFDLDGFKNYNDSFGHPAGDALLARLAQKLALAVAPDGQAYRMGGDEFCTLVPAGERLLHLAAGALQQHGEHLAVSSSFGAVTLPDEAGTTSQALGLADQRLYACKDQLAARRGNPHELLLRTLAEREPHLREHLASVATLAIEVGKRLGLTGNALDELKLAAELHDVGKLAIPDEILQHPGPLTDDDWRFLHEHTLIGQRILAGLPALRPVGEIVRSTHEHWDGNGYPDRLAGEDIPVAARVIAACDAYSAIVSDRPYRPARTPGQALAELRRCAGTQFDPQVVAALGRVLEADPFRAGSGIAQFRVAQSHA